MPRAGSSYDRSWQKLRTRFLRAMPRCRICGARATDVDHIVSLKRAPELRLDWTNLQPLCHACHSRITNAYDRPGWEPRGGCDAEGHTIDQRHPWARMGDQVGRRVQGKQDWVHKALAGRYDWRHRKLEDW
jgi:hypothetical protein